MITKIELGQRIAVARKRLRITQSHLGKLFGNITHAAISDIERGKTSLSIEKISIIANLLHITFEELTADNSVLTGSIFQMRSFSDSQDIPNDNT